MAHPLVDEWRSGRGQANTVNPIVAEWRAKRAQSQAVPQMPISPEVAPQRVDGPKDWAYERYGKKDALKNIGQDVLGYLEGATLGVPRAIVEQTAGRAAGAAIPEIREQVMNLPRGSKGGQLIGSFSGLGALSDLVRSAPFLGSKTIKTAGPIFGGVRKVSNTLGQRALRGGITGALAANAPMFTDVDEKPIVRGAKTATGAVLGGFAEAAIPPIIDLVGGKTPAFLRSVKKVINPSKKTFQERVAGRSGQIKEGAEKVVRGEKEMIGQQLASQAESAAQQQLRLGQPGALKQAGLNPKEVSFVQSWKGQHPNAKQLPTEEGVNKLFRDVMSQDMTTPIDVKGFKGPLGAYLRKMNIIDKSGKLVPGITPDSRQVNGLIDVYENLTGRIKGQGRIPKLLNQTEGDLISDLPETLGGGKFIKPGNLTPDAKRELTRILKNPDTMDKPLYERTKMGLKSLLGADEEANIPVREMINKLDDLAEQAGLTGLKSAKTTYAVSKLTSGLKSPTSKEFQTKLVQAAQSKNDPIRKELRELLGSEADNILNQLGKGEIAKEEAARKLASIQSRSSTRDYLNRKKFGVQNLASGLAKGAGVVGGGLFTLSQLKKIMSNKNENYSGRRNG